MSSWKENGAIVSTSASYSFTANADRSLTAVFSAVIPTYTISASIDPAGSGTVTGAGQYQKGAIVTLVAAAGDGYEFSGWQENGQTVSTGETYTFTATAARTLTAAFEEAPQYEAGVDWWGTTLPPYSSKWHSVTYGSGKFVAVAYNSNVAAYSVDGINWTAATLPSSADWCSVAYGNGKFVAVSRNYGIAAYSEDGINWTAASISSSMAFQSVTYGNGKFVAVRNNSNAAAYSVDGINWTAATLPSSANWYSVTYGSGKFVAVANGSNAAAYSSKYGPNV